MVERSGGESEGHDGGLTDNFLSGWSMDVSAFGKAGRYPLMPWARQQLWESEEQTHVRYLLPHCFGKTQAASSGVDDP